MTKFESIYDKFLSKITDFSITRISREILEEDLKNRLISAVAAFPQLPEEKTILTEDGRGFIADLSHEEQEIIAYLMIINYLDKYIVAEDNMRILLNSKDYKQYSQATLLKELKSTKNDYLSYVDGKKNSYSFRQIFKEAKE